MTDSKRSQPPQVRPVFFRTASLMIALLLAPPALAQETAPTPGSEPTTLPNQSSAISITEIPRRLAAGRGLILEANKLYENVGKSRAIADQLDTFSETIASSGQHLEELLKGSHSSFAISESRSTMANLLGQTDRWLKTLTQRASSIEDVHQRLDAEISMWSLTRENPDFEELPNSLISKINQLVAELEEAENDAADHLGDILIVQARVAQQNQVLGQNIARADGVFKGRTMDLITIDGPPLWRSLTGMGQDGTAAWFTTWPPPMVDTVLVYARANIASLALQTMVWVIIAGFLVRTRKTFLQQPQEDVAVSAVLSRPISSSLLMVILIGIDLFHPNAPRDWRLLSYLMMLFLLLRLLPALWPPSMKVSVYAVAGLGLVHWAALEVPEDLALNRIIWFVASALGTAVIPFVCTSWRRSGITGPPWFHRTTRTVSRLTAATLAISTLANVGGAVSLAIYLASGTLVSVYAAVIVTAVVLIANGIAHLALASPFAQRFRIARAFKAEAHTWIGRLTFLAGVIMWLLLTFGGFQILSPVLAALGDFFSESLSIGSIEITPGNILLFVVAVWLSFKLSRIFRFVLNEEVYPRVHLPQGVPETLNKAAHYAVLFAGFVFAVMAAGFSLDRFALIAGAFSVGIGFGLQTVVNNFVSGLILLFERPVRVGDRVQVGETIGEITEIGIRASRLRTVQGAEIVVPNGNLISSELINWTLSDIHRRLDIVIGVAYGTDPEKVVEILTEIADAEKLVLQDPPPQALFMGFGDSSLDFELRAWCPAREFFEIGSALRIAINRAFNDAGIEIPFPQHDLHLRSIDENAVLRASKSD